MSIQYEKGRAAFAVFEDGIIMEGEPLCIDGMTGLIFRESVS
jgi:hypothetical protein